MAALVDLGALERLVRLNRPEDLASLIQFAERFDGRCPEAVFRLPGGREVAAALPNDGVLAMLRECLGSFEGLPRPAPRKRKHESVVCCGSWEAADTPVRWETTSVAVGGGFVELTQCASHYFCSGCRVWSSAIALARFLTDVAPETVRNARVCELGAGVGLVGRAVLDLGAAAVTVTDRERRLLGCLAHNTLGRAAVRALDWTADPRRLRQDFGEFDVVVGADLVYSSGATQSGFLDAAAALLRSNGTLLLCCPDGRHGLVELFAGLRGDDRWTATTSSHVDPALLPDLEDHAFLLIRATRTDRGTFPDQDGKPGGQQRAASPSGGPATPRS